MHEHSTTDTNTLTEKTSVLAALRALLPPRRLLFTEAQQIAERQASRLLLLRDVSAAPVPDDIVTCLPRILIDYDPDLPRHAASGVSDWDIHKRTWVISVNPDEPATRQRITILHEYKHIIDHYHPGLGGRLPKFIYGLRPDEFIAEYFAGCVRMPRAWIKAAYCDGIQDPLELAGLFDVSVSAMQLRLEQIGLVEPTSRTICTKPGYRLQPKSFHRYHRPLSLHYRPVITEEVAV